MGLIVLSPSLRLLHLNPEGIALLRLIEAAWPAHGVLPPQLLQIGEAVRLHRGFETRTLEGREGTRMTLYAFQVTGRSAGSGHILLLLKEVSRGYEERLRRAIERYRLTEREAAVASCVVRGSTNKEIAAAIGIAEQTVKRHITSLMEKTGVRSRTGLLTVLLQPGELRNTG